jgi:hypothetical protein
MPYFPVMKFLLIILKPTSQSLIAPLNGVWFLDKPMQPED